MVAASEAAVISILTPGALAAGFLEGLVMIATVIVIMIIIVIAAVIISR
jgi:hypothetical protein